MSIQPIPNSINSSSIGSGNVTEAELDAQHEKIKRLIAKNKSNLAGEAVKKLANSSGRCFTVLLGSLVGALITAVATSIIFGPGAAIVGFLLGGFVGGMVSYLTDRNLTIDARDRSANPF